MENILSKNKLSILVVEDDDNLRSSIVANLEDQGYLVTETDSGKDGLDKLNQGCFQIVLTDFRLPEMDGISFVKKATEKDQSLAIIVMSAYGNSDIAIEAVRAGAYDYIAKPFSGEELVLTVKKIEERERLRSENAALKSEISKHYSFSNIIAQSQSMVNIFETIKRLSNFNTTVLITGESGTGKELLARAIHNSSPRRNKPFIAINCGAIPENLMESELFGHKKGAFTDATRDKKGLFEEANGGTVFLDEIGELPMHLQVKLLRALQEKQIRRVGDEENIEIDLRIVAATLRNLEEDIAMGRFREDLFYRLNVVSIHIPALRERPEDIVVLVQHFIKKHGKNLGIKIKGIEPNALKILTDYYWRGNVRELENCIERAMVLCEGEKIDSNSLPDIVKNNRLNTNKVLRGEPQNSDSLSIKQRGKALEIDLILKALEVTKGNRTHAAKILEISHRALLYKIKEYGLGSDGSQSAG